MTSPSDDQSSSMTYQRRRRQAWALWGAMIVAYVVEVVLLFANTDLPIGDPVDTIPPWIQALEDLAFVAVGTLGLRVVLTQPFNAVGWWIMLAGLGFPLEGLTVEFTRYGIDRWGAIPIVAIVSWVSLWVWVLTTYSFSFILLLYPNGRLPSPRWRPAYWLNWALMLAAFAASAFFAEPEPVPGVLPNPLGVPALRPLFEAMEIGVFLGGQLVMVVLGLLSLAARYRSSDGIVRQQVKVLIWVAAVAFVFFAVSALLDDLWIGSILNFVFTIFVGAAVTLAILRYRLFDIDRLISRSVTYAVVAGALALVYGFGAVWLPSRIVVGQTPLFVAGSTLVVAALFNPLRRRVMRSMDRRFNRSSYDFEQITDRFAARLRDHIEADRLAQDWATVVTTALQPSALGIWVRDRSPSQGDLRR